MENTAISSKILDRIKKLLALSDNNSNVNEAATAYAQAQALLLKHRLTMAEVEAAQQVLDSGHKINESAIPLYEGIRVIHWKSYLADTISKHNGVKTFIRYFRAKELNKTVKKCRFVLVGRPSDVEIVNYLFNSISAQIEIFCKQALTDGIIEGKTGSNNFKMGVVETVKERLDKVREEIRQEYKGSTGLVLLDQRDQEVTKWINDHVGKLKSIQTSNSNYDSDARSLGKKAGHRVSLNSGLNKGPSTKYLR